GAGCVSSARPDLRGGWQVTAIPTATSYITSRHFSAMDGQNLLHQTHLNTPEKVMPVTSSKT
ncbi:hypothetical protein NHN17_18575, partial [Photobacterium sp. ZSDE20]